MLWEALIINSVNGLNDFLLDLLTLQQDGAQSISAPSNWISRTPLLEVPTETDGVIEELCNTMLKENNDNNIARWHFFIGSPGNGKSAAVGKLCRYLIGNKSCKVLDEDGTLIGELAQTAIPYAIHVFEGENKFTTATIVQDASVVRSPFADKVDPANELLDTLEESWEKGKSLIVCTNRGVIEKAFRERYLETEFNTKTWFKILRKLMDNGEVNLHDDLGDWNFESHKCIFSKVRVTYSYLDNRSMLLGSNVFSKLILKATEDSHWSSCLNCNVSQLCPFKANRDWLTNDSARENFLHVLERSEVLSGQVIVLREALALLSLILSGCPRDYVNVHPCEWVRIKLESGDLFALATRRIYMSIFSSSGRYGLEINQSSYERQIKALSTLYSFIDDRHCQAATALCLVLKDLPLSTDVGVVRLTRTHGIFSQVDPWCECLPPDFLDDWDSDLAALAIRGNKFFTEIEIRCIEAWSYLEDIIESTSSHDSSLCHWALNRWSSNFLIHFGSLIEGRTSWADELDEFIGILNAAMKEPSSRTIEEKRRIRELDRQLEDLLAARMSDHAGQDVVPLSSSVTLTGRWVVDNLRPRINTSKKTPSLSIMVDFLGGSETAILGARAFLWLSRHLHGKLDERCFPPELLTGIIDARIRAASKGHDAYAFANDEVELLVNAGEKESFTLSRLDGDVHVEQN